MNRKGNIITDRAWKVPNKLQYIFSAEYLVSKYLKPLQYDKDYFCDEYVRVGCVPGSLLLVSIKAFLEVGGYDEKIFLYGEETTLGIKMNSIGYTSLLNTHYTYIHMHSISINRTISSVRKQRKMTLNSRYYILRTYLKANTVELFLAKIVFAISVLEYGIMERLKKQGKDSSKG